MDVRVPRYSRHPGILRVCARGRRGASKVLQTTWMSMGIGDHAVVQLRDFTGKSCAYLWAAVLSIWSGAGCSSSTWRNSNLRLPVPSALPQILSNMSFPATDQLRTEHRAMERLLERFEGELRDPQGESLLALAKTFAETQKHLAGHFAKE